MSGDKPRSNRDAARPSYQARTDPVPPTPQDEWIDEGRVRGGKGGPRRPKPTPTRNSRRKPPPVEAPELTRSVGKERAKRLEGRIEEAARAFAAERYIDSRRLLKPIAKEVPDSPEVRELYGLTLYRLGKWRDAAAQLETFGDLTAGSVEQHPVLADCYRALGRYADVDRLWVELREVSPSAELMTEGRIVTAGSLADRGRLSESLAMLAKGFKLPARSEEHHLRRAYALADLYERSGDLPQARQLFTRIAALAPGYVDVEDRLESLG